MTLDEQAKEIVARLLARLSYADNVDAAALIEAQAKRIAELEAGRVK